jgi:hypothetical protein
VPALQRRLHDVAPQERGSTEDEDFQSRSQTEAMPCPTPMHIAATP